MNERVPFTAEQLPLYAYYNYSNLIRSTLLRGKGRVHPLPEKGGAILFWGISILIGGEFSTANAEEVRAVMAQQESPRYVYFPAGPWGAFLKKQLSGRAAENLLRVYRFDPDGADEEQPDLSCIVPVTRRFLEEGLPGTDLILDELYSYRDREDFLQNGFGFAAVADGAVIGYCLSEYSIQNTHGVNIWVDEACRRQGYARKLAQAVKGYCRKNGQTALWVCNGDNLPSNRLARLSGFVPESEMTFLEL